MLGSRTVTFTSPRPLPLHPLARHRAGRGIGHAFTKSHWTILIQHAPLLSAGALAAVSPGDPLIVRLERSGGRRTKAQLRIDGIPYMTLAATAKTSFTVTVEPHIIQPLGVHTIALVGLSAGGATTLAIQTFDVQNGDDENPCPPLLPPALSFVCPASATAKTPLSIAGKLTPAFYGTSVTLTYTEPPFGTTTQQATVGFDGSFTDTFTPIAPGSLTIGASWPGNPEYQATKATSCQVKVS